MIMEVKYMENTFMAQMERKFYVSHTSCLEIFKKILKYVCYELDDVYSILYIMSYVFIQFVECYCMFIRFCSCLDICLAYCKFK